MTEVDLAGFVDVQGLTGDVDQTGVETEEEEHWLQRYLRGDPFNSPLLPSCQWTNLSNWTPHTYTASNGKILMQPALNVPLIVLD